MCVLLLHNFKIATTKQMLMTPHYMSIYLKSFPLSYNIHIILELILCRLTGEERISKIECVNPITSLLSSYGMRIKSFGYAQTPAYLWIIIGNLIILHGLWTRKLLVLLVNSHPTTSKSIRRE